MNTIRTPVKEYVYIVGGKEPRHQENLVLACVLMPYIFVHLPNACTTPLPFRISVGSLSESPMVAVVVLGTYTVINSISRGRQEAEDQYVKRGTH